MIDEEKTSMFEDAEGVVLTLKPGANLHTAFAEAVQRFRNAARLNQMEFTSYGVRIILQREVKR